MEFLKPLPKKIKILKPKNNKKEKESKQIEKFIYTKTKKIPIQNNKKLSNIERQKISTKKIIDEKEEHFFDNDYINASNTKQENSNNNINNNVSNNRHNSFCISINNNYTYNLSINSLGQLEKDIENKNLKNQKINIQKNDIENNDEEEEFTFNQKKEINNEEKTAEFPDIINNEQKEYFIKTRTLTKGRFDYSSLDKCNKNINK